MSDTEEENVKKLFERFVNAGSAEQAARDIDRGEVILREYAAPEPGAAVLAKTKSAAAVALIRRKTVESRRVMYKVVAVAAVLFVAVVVAVKVFQPAAVRAPGQSVAAVIPSAVWQGDDIADADADIAVLTAEVDQVVNELAALRLGDDGSNGQAGLYDVEMELIDISSDFWKG